MEDYKQLDTISLALRPYTIALNADGSRIVLKIINEDFIYYKRRGNKWQIQLIQNIKLLDNVFAIKLNDKGNAMALISRRREKFWFDYLSLSGSKFVLRNSFIIKNDPDGLRGLFYFSICDSLQFCSSDFQWRNGYKRIHTFSNIIQVKRIRRQLLRCSELFFNSSEKLIAITYDNKIFVHRYFSLDLIIFYESESKVQKTFFGSPNQLFLFNDDGLIELDYVKNAIRKINIKWGEIKVTNDFEVFDDKIIIYENHKVKILKQKQQRVQLIREIQCNNFRVSRLANLYLISDDRGCKLFIFGKSNN